MSEQSLAGEDNVSERNNSSSLRLVYILSKFIPTVLLKSSFSSFKAFVAFSGSRTSPPELQHVAMSQHRSYFFSV